MPPTFPHRSHRQGRTTSMGSGRARSAGSASAVPIRSMRCGSEPQHEAGDNVGSGVPASPTPSGGRPHDDAADRPPTLDPRLGHLRRGSTLPAAAPDVSAERSLRRIGPARVQGSEPGRFRLPKRTRCLPERRRAAEPRHTARRHGKRDPLLPRWPIDHTAHASPHCGDGPPAARSRPDGDRTLARPRVGRDDADLPPCRHALEGASPRAC